MSESDLLKDYPIIVEFPVAWGDMDAFSHVNNTKFFKYFENARIAYFDAVDYMGDMEQTGIGPILASTDCRFIAPLTFPDTVKVGARVTKLEEDRFVMEYCVVSEKLGRVAGKGEGLLVSYDYRNSKKAPITPQIMERIKTLEKMQCPS